MTGGARKVAVDSVRDVGPTAQPRQGERHSREEHHHHVADLGDHLGLGGGQLPAQNLEHLGAAVVEVDEQPLLVAEVFVERAPPDAGGGHPEFFNLPLREAREIFEREYLLAQVNRFGGNISRTAEFVGMERSALHRKLKALGMD